MDDLITGVFAALQLALIARLLWRCRSPEGRRRALPILGALTPVLVFYGWVSLDYFLGERTTDVVFTFGAMWLMVGLGAFVPLLLLGAILSTQDIPHHPVSRFALGLVPPLACGGLLAWLASR